MIKYKIENKNGVIKKIKVQCSSNLLSKINQILNNKDFRGQTKKFLCSERRNLWRLFAVLKIQMEAKAKETNSKKVVSNMKITEK